MLTDRDKEWLREKRPKLEYADERVSGIIEFEATYNAENGWFLIIDDGIVDEVGGERLHGQFDIDIRERTKTYYSKLPTVHCRNVTPTAERHFNQSDQSACLCSPLEEKKYLYPQFSFQVFLDRLVIPFLYGQLFYSQHQRWPWPEYEHGAIGLLESYLDLADPKNAKSCLEYLERDPDWRDVRVALARRTPLKGHTPCFCGKNEKIRNCHPRAWKGIRQLRADLTAQSIPIA